jgi:hypothetical protein
MSGRSEISQAPESEVNPIPSKSCGFAVDVSLVGGRLPYFQGIATYGMVTRNCQSLESTDFLASHGLPIHVNYQLRVVSNIFIGRSFCAFALTKYYFGSDVTVTHLIISITLDVYKIATDTSQMR